MSERTHPNRRVRLVYRHSKPLTKLVVAAAILLSAVTLFCLRRAQDSVRFQTVELLEQAQVLEDRNRQLEVDIALLGTPLSVEKIAREELGLVQPGTVFFQPEK